MKFTDAPQLDDSTTERICFATTTPTDPLTKIPAIPTTRVMFVFLYLFIFFFDKKNANSRISVVRVYSVFSFASYLKRQLPLHLEIRLPGD